MSAPLGDLAETCESYYTPMPCCTVSQGQGQPADCRDSVIDARKRPRAEPNERHSMHARMCRRIPSPGAALVTRSPSPGARYQDLASKRTAASSALDAFLQCAHSHTLSAARAIKLRRCNSQTARRARFSLCNSRILSTSAETGRRISSPRSSSVSLARFVFTIIRHASVDSLPTSSLPAASMLE